MIFWNVNKISILDYFLQIGYTDQVLHKRIPSCCGMNNKTICKKTWKQQKSNTQQGECEGVTKCRCGSE